MWRNSGATLWRRRRRRAGTQARGEEEAEAAAEAAAASTAVAAVSASEAGRRAEQYTAGGQTGRQAGMHTDRPDGKQAVERARRHRTNFVVDGGQRTRRRGWRGAAGPGRLHRLPQPQVVPGREWVLRVRVWPPVTGTNPLVQTGSVKPGS